MEYIIEYFYDIMAVCNCSEFNLNKCCWGGGCFYVSLLDSALVSVDMGWF